MVLENILDCIQFWAIGLKFDPRFRSMLSLYEVLKLEGYVFKEEKEVPRHIFCVEILPEWIDSEICQQCCVVFSLATRQHHCRNCGGAFCGTCSSHTAEIPKVDVNVPVRVCDTCFDILRAQAIHQNKKVTQSPEEFENQVKLAIKLSLEEIDKNNTQKRKIPKEKEDNTQNIRQEGTRREDTAKEKIREFSEAISKADRYTIVDPETKEKFIEIYSLQSKLRKERIQLERSYDKYGKILDIFNESLNKFEIDMTQHTTVLQKPKDPELLIDL